ncbi:hypothetical protein A2392_00235 [Candidatus Kaiserbacteria bacterium RIFOXYB1_FULL_46_14]|uniref:Lipid II flippase MurJ n=1 Tax=Candidatus Kaiserbacteria bacterium RIFOXYB1_FULL_46_14 TaxID=1798531 RepID=A0A1F6FJ01_9BACT|nr:MAG: hypothetical protein A2392_00235 [Candidatus Kaiserbacteria bacterium RIFOXYB1_FULL_46_14]
MVRQMINMVYKEVRGLHQAAYILALFALASQLLALLRDRLLAHQFGAGAELDIYYAAFRIPDLLFVLIISVSSVYVLIPFVSGAVSNGNGSDARRLLSQVFSLLFLVYTVVAVTVFIFVPSLLSVLFPNVHDQETLVVLTRILLLQPFLLGISGLYGVITQLSHRFVIYALSPLLYNAGIIIGILFFYPVLGLAGLGWGVVLGAILHFLVQWPLVRQSDLRIGFDWHFDWAKLRSVFAVSIPRSLALSMQQLVLLALVALAGTMATGSIAIFQFAYNLQSVPLAIIGVSYSVAAFPLLAELYSKANHEKFAIHVLTPLRHIIFWSMPTIALIVVLRAQLVRVVLGSGEFDWTDTRLTAAVLALLSLSLVAQAMYLVVVRAFYAGGRTRIPFYGTVIGSVLAIAFAYGFLLLYGAHEEARTAIASFMRLDGVFGSEVLAIAFGYSLATILQTIVLTWLMGKVFSISLSALIRPLVVAFYAAVVGGLAAYITLNFIVVGIDQERFLGVFIQGVLAGIAGLVGTVITYAYFESRELHEIYTSLHRKFVKTEIVAPQEEVF